MSINVIIANGSEQELADAILDHLGLTPEQAIEQLAEKLGVGGKAVALDQEEQDTLRRAAGILNRL